MQFSANTRQLGGDPARRRHQRRAHVAARRRLLRDEREEALGVRVAAHQRAVVAQVRVERVQPLDVAVVREHAPLLQERVRVLQRPRARGRVADVGEERPRLALARLAGEVGVRVGRASAPSRPPARPARTWPARSRPGCGGSARPASPAPRAARTPPAPGASAIEREQPAHQWWNPVRSATPTASPPARSSRPTTRLRSRISSSPMSRVKPLRTTMRSTCTSSIPVGIG